MLSTPYFEKATKDPNFLTTYEVLTTKYEEVNMSDCLFCKIIAKEIPAKIAHEDHEMIAIHDINPQAPTHLLVIPKKHVSGILAMSEGDSSLVGKLVYRARQIAAENHLNSFRLVFNEGAESGQSVFHIHLHLLSGRRMAWPPG